MILKTIADEKIPEPDNSIFFTWLLTLASFLLIFVVISVISIWVSRQTKQKLDKMTTEWLETFYMGQQELIDWNKDVVLQAGFLPYRSEFEFPIENLEIGDELGHGEFGVVHRATAKGLGQDGCEIEVAVKTTKNLKIAEIRAFADELKIMMFLQKVHRESHTNIINLLGSITMNIKKGEIYAIIEFCQYGSLKEFVSKNSRKFLNQFDHIKSECEAIGINNITKNFGYL